MSQSPQLDLSRYRMNSRSSIDQYSPSENYYDNPSQSGKPSIREIPLILKKMNSVEKYVHDYKVTEMLQKRHRPKRSQSPLYDPSLSQSQHLKKLIEKSSDSKLKEDDLKDLEGKCYIKYSSISEHDTGKKYELLENAQTQYVRLKHSIHTATINEQPHQTSNKKFSVSSQTRHSHSKSADINQPSSSVNKNLSYQTFVNPKSIYLLNKKKNKQLKGEDENKIHLKDVQKELKTTLVEDGGKKYFADLYLMKKERDKMLREIFGATEKKAKDSGVENQTNNSSITHGNIIDRNASYKSNKTSFSLQKHSKALTNNELHKKFPKLKVNLTQVPVKPSDENTESSKQNFIEQKILKDRQQKKEKMLKGRNMNWNVYYEMLALKRTEKDKLKGYCKFSQTYGED